jgi:hypothetical protein
LSALNFYFFSELTINQRQGEGTNWSEMLLRIRVAAHTAEDIAALEERRIGAGRRATIEESVDRFLELTENGKGNVFCILPTNVSVSNFNAAVNLKKNIQINIFRLPRNWEL